MRTAISDSREDARTGVALRILGGETLGDRVQLITRRRDCDSIFQACDREDAVGTAIAGVHLVRLKHEWDVEVDVGGKSERRRRNADYGIDVSVEADRLPHEPRIRAVLLPPQMVRHHDHLRGVRLVFAFREDASTLRLDAQEVEEPGAHHRCLKARRFGTAAGDVHRPVIDCGHADETPALVAVVDEVERRHHIGLALAIARGDEHQLLRLAKRQRLEEHAVHDAEGCRGGANREREGGYRNEGKSGRVKQLARGVSQILEQSIHGRG